MRAIAVRILAKTLVAVLGWGCLPSSVAAAAACRAEAGDPVGLVAYERSHRYRASDADSKISSRKAAMAEVSALLLAEIGVHVVQVFQSRQYANGAHFASEDIEQVAAGVASIRVMEEHWDGQFMDLRACLKVDPQEVQENLQALVDQRQSQQQQQEQLQRQQEQISRLQADLSRIQQQMQQTRQRVDEQSRQQALLSAVAAPTTSVLPATGTGKVAAATMPAFTSVPKKPQANHAELAVMEAVLPMIVAAPDHSTPRSAVPVMPAITVGTRTLNHPAANNLAGMELEPVGSYPLFVRNRSRDPITLAFLPPESSQPVLTRSLAPGFAGLLIRSNNAELRIGGQWQLQRSGDSRRFVVKDMAEWSERMQRWELDADLLEVAAQR
ncbi:hypothetical protein [Parathalassolituus penaei]|uniref:Uncharacterized protein n=1 Tax=Parathalassolituus penaei TaxID=2997323 RepID=A0A9X3EC05_9GAMM|nr:hypothetical protein [Parathalassolituus penaei]MCY0964069.1 hypothetical protein [Parathalassolituus penaei]